METTMELYGGIDLFTNGGVRVFFDKQRQRRCGPR